MASVFDEFVKRKTQQSDDFDRNERIEKWRSKLSDLNKQVDSYLKDFTESGAIKIARHPLALHEELLGSYEVDGTDISIGDTKVELKPLGTILLGGIGRADLVGRGEPIMLVLAQKTADRPEVRITFGDQTQREDKPLDWSEWVWKIAIRQPSLRYIELSKSTFQDALMSVAG